MSLPEQLKASALLLTAKSPFETVSVLAADTAFEPSAAIGRLA